MDHHLEFHVDATPIGKATISLLVAYGYLHGLKMAPATETITGFGNVCSMYGRSPLRSTLNTNVITGLDMCALCTEAVHSVAL